MMIRASLPADRVLLAMGLVSLALIAGALGFQYLGGIAPCEMCHWQRWPHITTALLALLAAPMFRKDMGLSAMLIVALMAIGGLIAAFSWKMLGVWQAQFLAAVIVALVMFALWKKDGVSLATAAIVLMAISGLIGAYQTGTQIGWLPAPAACTIVGGPYMLGSNVVPEVSCIIVPWSLFGLSLAAYNAIISLLVAGSAALLLVKRK